MKITNKDMLLSQKNIVILLIKEKQNHHIEKLIKKCAKFIKKLKSI